MNDGDWHHVVGVWESDSLRKIYVDGVYQAGSTTTKTIGTINRWAIGRIADDDGSFTLWNQDNFEGSLDEVQVYSGALTAAQVRTLYNQGKNAFGTGGGSGGMLMGSGGGLLN